MITAAFRSALDTFLARMSRAGRPPDGMTVLDDIDCRIRTLIWMQALIIAQLLLVLFLI